MIASQAIPPKSVYPPFKQAVREYVLADPEASAQITSLELLQVQEHHGAQSLTYTVQTRTQESILDGPAQHDDVDCTIKIRGVDSVQVDALALRIRALFNGRPNWIMAGLPVMASWVTADTDDYDSADDASDEGLYIQLVNIFVRHRL